jgi:hypothetical protein
MGGQMFAQQFPGGCLFRRRIGEHNLCDFGGLPPYPGRLVVPGRY